MVGIDNVYISRLTDGLLLLQSAEHTSSPSGNGAGVVNIDVYRNQAKQFLRTLNARSPARMSVDSNPYVYHYIIENNIVYLILTDKSYPTRLASCFLDDISQDFVQSLKEEYGDEWLRTVETIGKQYAFLKFDRNIQRRRREYMDPSSTSNVKKLTEDLASIHNVMRKTIDDVFERGTKLDDVSEMSKNLATESKRMRWNAKKLSMMALWKQYMPVVAIVTVVATMLFVNFYIFG